MVEITAKGRCRNHLEALAELTFVLLEIPVLNSRIATAHARMVRVKVMA